ncbi:RUS family member 1 [Drosophila grimshawi]|uniref:GH19230 n=1 Tax=Drosophila grimshawi TaxID=7222 RepID=B4JRZ5_DROGR|nr:RUS family member 1 [Drosophila grimshawi]EDV94535.1 GH19230 [Drosophila grimshawi]
MVAYYDESAVDGIDQPKTLTYWVRNFRMKRVQMRRKMRGSGSLRVNAILSTALFHAEHELRRKQQERFSRWLDIQTKLTPHGRTHCASDADEKYQHNNCDGNAEKTAEFERRNIENNLWRNELSGLDNFLSSLSSSKSNNNNGTNNGSSNNYNSNKQSSCAIAVSS